MKGFESVAQDNVSVTVDQVTTVNIALRVGSVNEVVTVTESTSLVETSNSTVGQLISARPSTAFRCSLAMSLIWCS